MNTRIISPKRHIPRIWQSNRYWQTVLIKNPRRLPLIDDGLTDEDFDNIPDSLKMPTTRAGLNSMRMGFRKDRAQRRVKTVWADKFWREIRKSSLI